ncbi:MAG: FAD-binding oxidoreductase, partial [Caldilineaceae bacterium]|nr:FAD-binding oxidoreductase [Caldilineaceae bacterium]
LAANVVLQQSVGIQTALLSPAELAELAPGMADMDDVVAAYEPEGGYADPWLTVNSFGAAARRHGATILTQTEVTGVRMVGGRVQGVITDKGEIAAGAVVNTAGPWGAHIARMAGVELPIQPCRVQVTFVLPPPESRAVSHVFVDFPNVAYYRPETGGMTLVGSVDPAEANHHADPDDYNERVDLAFVEDAWMRFAHRFPVMERGASRGGYAGVYDVTPDWHPVIDETPGGSGFFSAVGHSGHGFKLAPAVGVMVADLVTGQRTAGLDPALFRYARYAEGKPVRGRYEYSIAG